MCVCCRVLSLPVCGQSTLDDCIRYAWEHNPGFKNIRIDVKEARTDYVAAMGKFLPYVSVQAEVGRHIGRLSIRILMDIQPIHINQGNYRNGYNSFFIRRICPDQSFAVYALD